MKRLFKIILLLSFFLNPPFALSETPEPLGIIKSITEKVLNRVESDQEKLKDNPGEMYNLVSDLIFPNFDFAYVHRKLIVQDLTHTSCSSSYESSIDNTSSHSDTQNHIHALTQCPF